MDVPIACPCPPKGEAVRHPEGDTVVLRDKLGYAESMTVRNTVRLLRMEGANVAQALAGITECYLRVGITDWTLRDAEDKPVPVNNQTISDALLMHLDQAMTVSDAADELYQEAVMAPLVQRDYGSSQEKPTEPSISAMSPTGPESQTRQSPQSSTTTTQTDGTVTTSLSLVGASSTSQNGQSAA